MSSAMYTRHNGISHSMNSKFEQISDNFLLFVKHLMIINIPFSKHGNPNFLGLVIILTHTLPKPNISLDSGVVRDITT
jgi:hypothetical protein